MKQFFLVFLLLSQLIVKAQVPTSGLVAHFPFNGNTSNSTAINVTGTTFGTSYTTNNQGVANKAIQFAGSLSSYVDFVDNGNFDFGDNSNFSVSFGFLFNGNATGGMFDNCLNYGGYGVWLWSTVAGTWNVQFNYKNNSVGSAAATNFAVNQWNHVVAVRNSGTISLYINGVLKLSATEGTLTPSYPINANAGAFTFSSFSPPRYNPFSGKLDELRIYNRAVSTTEVTALYNDFLAGGEADAIICPPNKTIRTVANQTTIAINNIDPVLTGTDLSNVNYTLSGATTGSGTGSASGATFARGITTVTYSLINDPSTTCSFTVNVLEPKYYVNSNSTINDVFTTAVGNNSNPGTTAAPYASVTYALSQAGEGDTIYIDAGTYAEQITIEKGITIIGAGSNLTSIINPATPLVPPPGPFTEYSLIQTTQNIGDVHISNLQTTNNPVNDGHSILLQTGGSVKNCRIIDGSLGIYVRVESATKTVIVENNFIQASVFAVACQGPGVTATVLNNTMNLINPFFSVGIWVGVDFGPIAKLTATGNAINNYVYRGIVGNSSNTVLSENSILGTGQYAIENTATPATATCNWFGTTDPAVIATKLFGTITYKPFLTSGTDNSSDNGFQPLPNFCVGGLKKLYVNDNNTAGDIFTTAVGNDNNSGASNSPLATIASALSKANVGDTILVDAGDYSLSSEMLINKSITLLGTNYNISPNSSSNKPDYNTARNTESRITGARLALSADDIIIKGFRFSPNISAIGTVNNTNLKNIVVEKNYFDIIAGGTTVTLSATAFNPTTAINHTVIDNRFNRIDNSFQPMLDINGLKDVVIDNNVFIETGTLLNRGTAIRTSGGRIVENINITNNYIKRANNAILTFILKNAMIQNNVFDSCSQGFNMTPNTHPGPLGSSDITITQNTFKDLRSGRSVLLRNGEYGVSNFIISNNTINQSVNGINGIVSLIQLEYINTSATQIINNSTFGTTQVLNNVINISGDYLQNGVGSNNAIQLTGNHSNTTIAGNELNFTAINATTPTVPGIFPPVPTGIYIRTDGGAGYGTIPASATITVTNNKINGFKSSIGIYDPSAAGTTVNVGYGFLTNGANVTINNNSITNDSMSIDNGTVSQLINATCNWYGSADAVVVFPKISTNVTYGPWLTNGNDNDAATGFQPLPNVCNGRQNKFYVNDALQTGDVFTTAAGNDANTGIPSAPLATVNAAITKAQAGDTIYVDAGTYAETNLTIGKSVTILGSNYLLSPNDATNALNANGARTTEAIISNTTWTIGASDIKVKGLTFDPQSKNALAQSNNTLDFDNIEISNNIFLVTSTTTPVNLLGKHQQPLVTFNYSITNNRFIKSVAGNGSNITMAAVDGILISGNTFTTNNSAADWTQNAYFSSGSFRNNNFVISNNTSYRTRFTYQSLNAIKAQVTNNKVYETVRFLIDFNGLNVPTEIDITDNVVTIANSNGGPVISYSKSNGTDLSAPNIARIERNIISADATGWTNIPQTLIAPTLDNLSLNTQVYIRTNKLSVTGDFSSLTVPNTYVSAIRYLNNSRYTLVENNEMEFTAINFNPANKFGIGLVTSGLQPGTNFNFINNKFNGFPTSVGVQNSGAVNGYGGLPEGVVLNINYNSFTGDVMSINNGTSGQSANAGCNWYGSAAAQNFIGKLTLPTVDIVPWLTNGTDNDVATGFQQVPGSCDGYPTLITLNSSTNVTCNGAENGTINITTSYGKAPFTYTWTKEGDANFVSHDEDPTGLAPGTYTLSILDGNGSNIYITDPEADGPGVITVVITEPDVLTATANGSNNICFNGAIGSASVTPAGGTTPYTYLWSNGGTTNEITNLAAGVYNVTVTDANGCTATTSYEVTQPTLLTANASGTNVSCFNGSNGTASVTAGGGTTPYTYLWSNGGTTNEITNLAAGVYNVTVTDANGCTATTSYEVTQPTLLTANASGTNVSCFNGSNGTASVTAGGGTTPYTYLWSNGGTTNEISNLAAGVYNVIVTDANGCTATTSYEVTQPTLLTATITNSSTACSNIATVNAGGGSPGYSYLWSNGSTSATISGVPVGTYTVTVTDANGCTATASINLTVAEAFNPSASVTNVTCFGVNNGVITVTNANGTAPFMFSKDGGVTFVNGTLPFSFTGLEPGTYTIAVKDVNGCVGFVERTVTQPTQIAPSIVSVVSSCFGQSTGAVTVTVIGGNPAYTYSWTRAGGGFSSSQLNISGVPAGNYTLTVTDKNGCTAVLPVTVPSNNEILVNAAITNVLCRNTATGAINLTVTGGTGAGFTYSWTGAVISSNEDLNNIVAANNYNVRITDVGSGCFVNRTFAVTQPAANLSVSTTFANVTGCNSPGSITATGAGGTAPYAYNINGGEYQPSGSFTGLPAGTYTIGVRDANGCTASTTRTIADFNNDAYESNNSRNQSKPISIGTTISARISTAADVADWFSITTPAGGGSVTYSLSVTHPSVNYTFDLFPGSGNGGAITPSAVISPTRKDYLLAPGTSYRISVTTVSYSLTCYNLSIGEAIPITSRITSMPAQQAEVSISTVKDILTSTVYPNPHRGSFTLRIESPDEGIGTIEMYNANGQLLGEKKVNLVKGKGNVVQYNNMNHAVLFYRVHIGKHIVNGKIIGAN